MKRLAIVIILLGLLLGVAALTAQDSSADRDAAWRDDLAFLWERIQRQPDLFRATSQAEFEQMVSELDATIPELKERIAKTIEFIKGLKPAQIDGSEDKEIKITFPSGAVREFTGQSLLLNNSLPNFYFHCTTAYDILRHCGIELGKRDFMGTPVSL